MTEPLTREKIRSMRAAITVALKVGSESAAAFGTPEHSIRMVGKCGAVLHDGCMIVEGVEHEGRDLEAFLNLFAATPSIVDFYETALSEAEAKLAHIRNPGVEHDDPRVGYVTVQIDRDVWESLKAEKEIERLKG